ncbi:beta/gamma crystallin family protein [Actinomadura terrae]|uniref:beta/gamma crystallin family protein n=1 Tax=Actinomadura terrae TaxID=604353 RepID=UPI001FA6B54E|nr:beta/gamma crystallin family protein [Actinomadura terrae]
MTTGTGLSWMCRRWRGRGALVLALLTVMPIALASPAHAGWSRAQFWEHSFSGDKLDKDAPGSEADLSHLGRDCYVFWCENNWDNVISSLSTTGGGQLPAWLEIFEDPNFTGHCVLIASYQTLADLHTYTFNLPAGQNWGDRISSFRVSESRPASRCLVWPPGS